MDLQKVVLVSTQRGWRGGEEQARLLLLGLRTHGYQVQVIARSHAPFAERMQQEGFEVATFQSSPRSPQSILLIRQTLRRVRPDILHYNDPHALTAAGLASVGLRVPLRVMARRVDFPLSSARRYRWFADRIICVSKAVSQICEQGGIPSDRLHVVYDGVDPARMAAGNREAGRASLEVHDGQIVLLTVAALSDHKGHRFLIQAMPKIIAEHPDILLTLAGDGELRGELQSLSKSLGLENHVRFLGFRDDVANLIHAADLFVLPSRLEGLCSTLIDVMLAGTPIVATTAGGIPELLVDAGTGPVASLVAPENPDALASAILAAIRDPLARAQYVHFARERARQHFTAERMVKGTIDVYTSALVLEKKKN